MGILLLNSPPLPSFPPSLSVLEHPYSCLSMDQVLHPIKPASTNLWKQPDCVVGSPFPILF